VEHVVSYDLKLLQMRLCLRTWLTVCATWSSTKRRFEFCTPEQYDGAAPEHYRVCK